MEWVEPLLAVLAAMRSKFARLTKQVLDIVRHDRPAGAVRRGQWARIWG